VCAKRVARFLADDDRSVVRRNPFNAAFPNADPSTWIVSVNSSLSSYAAGVFGGD